MRITFKRVEIHNFMSFSDEIFDFDKHIGLNLICGKNNDIPGSRNGVGKSQLFESLCFALYGQTRNNIKNRNIWNKYIGSKEMRVTAYFDVEDSSYRVSSGFNKYGAPYCQVAELVNDDEIDMTKSSIIETRKFIESEVLHCDLSIFLRTILLSSDQNYNFFRLRKGEKKEFIEKLFDISIFGNMYNSIHRDILNHDKDIISRQNKLLVLNNNSTNYKEHIERFNKQKNEKLKQINDELKSLITQQEALKTTKIVVNSTEVEKYKNAIDKLNTAIDKLQSSVNELTRKNDLIDVQLHKLNSSKEQKQKIIDKHSTLMSKLCNDCKKIFSDHYNISNYEKDIQTIETQNSTLAENKTQNVDKLKKLNLTIDDYSSKIDKANLKIKALTKETDDANRLLTKVETQIVSYENEIHKLEDSNNPYDELLEKNEAELAAETKELTDLAEKYKYLKFAENIVSQDTLRKFIISDLIGLLNNKIKMYLMKFGAKYNVKFDADMDYEFITEAGTCEYDNFSAGERARLMIAACFAFRDFMYIRNNLSSNILILDEFIDGAIDSLAIESILDILKDFSEMWKQNIFVISHRKEINNDVFNNIIQVVKTNNIAKITYLD